MSKRAAAVQLTSDNYEQDDRDCEEPGRFEQASEDQLKQRVIKKAARRNLPGSGSANGGTGGGGGLFAGLKTSATPSLGFGIGGLGAGPLGAGSLGRAPLSSISAGGQSNVMMSLNKKPAAMDFEINGVVSSGGGSDGGHVTSGGGGGGSEYLKQLQALNVGVSKWISSHVEKNPHVDLTPIFKDYEKHLKAIDLKYKPLSETESSQESECGEGPSSQGEESDCHGDSSSQVTSQETGTEDEGTTATEGNEGEDSQQQPECSSKEASTSSASVAEAVDDGSLLSLRAKLFYKKQDEYTELGVGTLKVQSSSGQSVCLLLRNDTSIGNILMNVRVTADVPMTLTKNNVIVVCPANPPLGKGAGEGGVVTYLIRVKTAQLAEKLHTTIKDNFN